MNLLNIDFLGLDAKDLFWYQMAIRATIVFILSLAFVRISGMRTFGTQSAFDVIVVITLGGILGRCIMGHYPFFASLIAAATIVLLHRLLSYLSARSKFIDAITEGKSILLFRNGKKQARRIKQYHITDKDLEEAIHEVSVDSFEQVKSIWLEPDGKISVIKK